jgi:glutathione synthase/RimK-type ligase-like ATP-grasp enzyme
MILLWGLLEDPTFQSVHDWLTRMSADVTFVNHAAIARTGIRMTSVPTAAYVLSYDDRSVRLDDITAAYLRPYEARDYTNASGELVSPGGPPQADVVHHLINAWADNCAATVINRPSAEGSNHSKLFQAVQIQKNGFAVPDSLITNDREEIRAFLSLHGSLIYKSMSSVRSIVKELDESVLDSIEKLGPVLVQQRIHGRNIRVHIVRDRVFACAIESGDVDYRYAEAMMASTELPPEVAERCVLLTKRLGLLLAGIDLIVTSGGEYYCLEVNTNPAFSCFEPGDDRPIARAVAETLTNRPRG